MEAGRRFGGGGGGSGRNLNMLRQHVESFRIEFSTVDDAVEHLRHRFPVYRRMKSKELTRLVSQILESSPSPGGSSRKKRKKIDESEERLQKIEEKYIHARRSGFRNGAEASTSSSSSASEVSTSEEVGPEEFDLMKSTLRKSDSEEKNLELEVANEAEERNKVGVVLRKDWEEKGKGSGREEEGKEGGPMFRDLGGMRGVLEDLEMEVFVPLYHPHVLRRLGVKAISGILLHGPPGCGKTKLAHAIANETGVPFYKITATEVVSGVSGASEENIRELFSKSYRTAPSIVFIDEIDAIASKRENLQREMERRIVTQLMTCMDEHHKVVQPVDASSNLNGSDRSPGFVLVIVATNRPDAIDPALRRGGRFDCEIELGVPDENARVEILSVLIRNCTLEGSVDLLKIARSTLGFVGADLDALVKKAGNLAMRRILNQRKSKLSTERADELVWWKRPWLPEEEEKFAITMDDFLEAAKKIQPSLRREGFSAIPNVRWEDVGGYVSTKHEFDLHVVRRIKSPEVYEKFGVNLEIGILLYGPPGCGKTLIAKAVANKAGANFIYVKGPELLDKYVGQSELNVRNLFSRARTCSPCIIFFDEVDALTTKRGIDGVSAGERILNQLLTELDGADQRSGVVVIGATNRPEVMDPAVLRPGRFGKHIYVPLPSSNERGSILRAIAKGRPIDPSLDLSAIGRMEACENFSGADLENLMHEAAMAAVEEAEEDHSSIDSFTIKTSHFEKALSKISPSVRHEQIQYYETWLESFKGARDETTNGFFKSLVTPAALFH